VANESRAVLYSREKRHSPLNERLVIENETAREKTADILADKGGRSFDSHGQGRHTMAKEETGPKRQEALAFARKIVAALDKAAQRGDCRDFGLIAAPEFLGMIRHELSGTRNIQPIFEIDKNVVGRDPKKISDLIERNF
jgi:protein required for attachment to host cells